MSITPTPSVGLQNNEVSSHSDVDFFRSDSALEDVEADPSLSAAPRQHVFDPEHQWYQSPINPANRPRPKQPGESSLKSPSQKLNPGLSSGSWVGPVSSPSSSSFSGNAFSSGSRLAFEQEEPSLKKTKVKKLYIIAAAGAIAIALATIIALVVVFGTKNGDSGESDGNQGLGGSDSQSGDSGGTTESPSIVIEDPVLIIYAGSWGNWSDYSSCPVTCAGGFKIRVRECLSGECVGVNTQTQSCNTDRCPPDAIYGTWSTWVDWGLCDKSCDTGVQFRYRECDKQSEDDEDCVGDANQRRDCNEFDCPDCDKVCDNGTLSSDCTHCECGETFYARVLTGGILLEGATISPVETPTAVIAETGADGMLNLTNQCLGVDYIVQKEDYISVEISTSNLGTGSVKVIDLAELQPLAIITHPQDRMRLVGESVTLCCESSGNPAATDYEWLRDDNIVVTTSGGTSSTLVLTSLTLADSGYYKCRANNDYGAIQSSEAHINVKESANEFCSTTPQSSVIELPDDCTYDGGSLFDVGECSPLACRGGDVDNGTCADDQDNAYCCGPVVYSVVQIVCEDDEGEYVLPINMAKECGCVLCPEPFLSVSGIAYGNETTLQQGDVISNGTVIAQTTQNGTFDFSVPIGTERISLLFKDTVNRVLLDTVYVVDFPRNAEGMYYITVLMLATALTVDLDSSAGAEIELPSIGNASEPIATVSIPANSFVNADGEAYTGTVTVSVGVVDPEDLTSLESAPGDFSAVGDGGETQQLESSGMMSISVLDADGNNLAVSAPVEIAVPTEDGNVQLWSLDTETGRWVSKGELAQSRKKSGDKTSKLNGIKYESTWYNFDRISDQACYSKLRIFKTADFEENEQVSGVSASVIIKTKLKGKKRGTNSLSKVRPYSENGDKNGYCIIHPCDSYRGESDYEYEGWIMANLNGDVLKPVNLTLSPTADVNGLSPADKTYGITSRKKQYHVNNFTLASSVTDGPFYDWEYHWNYSPQCTNAPIEHKHFRFSANICYKEFDTYKHTTKAGHNCIDNYYLLWNSLPSLEDSTKLHRIAFIKVYTPGMYGAKVIATSKVRNQRTSNDTIGGRGTLFGSRTDCIDDYYQVVCLEFKPPSVIGCSLNDTVNETETTLTVRVKGGYKVSRVNGQLDALAANNIRSGAGKKSFRMFVEHLAYGAEYGIYIAENTDKNIARRQAKLKCMGGTDDLETNTAVTSDNWAVEFSDCKDQTNIVIAIGRIRGHFYASNMKRVKETLSKIISEIDVSSDVRVALIDIVHEMNHDSSVIWDLNSENSQSSDIVALIVNAVTEEWYEYDHIYNDYWYDCYYDEYWSYWNHTIVNYANAVIDNADNSEAQNIVLFVGDYLYDHCNWCYCSDFDQVADIGKELSEKARMIHIQSYPDNYEWYQDHYGFSFATTSEDRFSFNQTQAVVDRLNSYGCLLGDE